MIDVINASPAYFANLIVFVLSPFSQVVHEAIKSPDTLGLLKGRFPQR